MPAARPARALTPPAALVATALTVAACTGGTPPPVPTTTAAPTTTAPTPSPTPTEDPNPAGLKPLPADEIDASFVTIENFFRAYEYALTSGDTAPFKALSTKTCKFCSSAVDDIQEFYDAGGEMTGGSFLISVFKLLPSTRDNVDVWRLELRQEDSRSLRSDGSTRTIPGFVGPVLVEVSTGPDFRISEVDTELDR